MKVFTLQSNKSLANKNSSISYAIYFFNEIILNEPGENRSMNTALFFEHFYSVCVHNCYGSVHFGLFPPPQFNYHVEWKFVHSGYQPFMHSATETIELDICLYSESYLLYFYKVFHLTG